MLRKISILTISSLILIVAILSYRNHILITPILNTTTVKVEPTVEIPLPIFKENKDSFNERFEGSYILNETGIMKYSSSKDWWVNSGGQLLVKNGTGSTLHGEIGENSEWRTRYSQNNPQETDGGTHPQNIFRLLTRKKWKNINQEVYVNIKKYNLSTDSHRNESNGIFLYNRFINGDNVYYTGIRVDGAAVIKKKFDSKYTTLAYKQMFEGNYNRETNPNILPLNTWMGIKSEVVDLPKDKVGIKFFVDRGDGVWNMVLEATDSGKIIKDAGYGGIRSDFMDAEFKNFKIEEISLSQDT